MAKDKDIKDLKEQNTEETADEVVDEAVLDNKDDIVADDSTADGDNTVEDIDDIEDSNTGDDDNTGDGSDDDDVEEDVLTGKEEGVLVINPSVSQDARWYVVHTYSGHENKVAITLKQRAEASGYTDRIFKMYIPQQQKIVVSEGKKRSVEERLFPGYLIVQMVMDDDSWYIVRSTPGVTGFVGMGATPTPLKEAEVRQMMRFTKLEAPKFEAKFSVGDSVKINDGPFRDFLGKVDEVNEEQGKVKVLVSVFGRETPVELDFTQVNRI